MRINDLAEDRQARTMRAHALEATVADPPVTDDDFLRVIVDSQPGSVRECPYVPRGDVDPSPGDAALVSESDQGNLWAVCWWPQ